MQLISSAFLVLALVLAVTIGPQTRPWSWGPAMLALGISVIAALPAIWRRDKTQGNPGILSFALLTAGWFAWRAWVSPVSEYGQADLLLLCCAIGAFVSVRSTFGSRRAEGILIWGIALLLAANLIVVGMQKVDPAFSPIFRARAGPTMISGFFAHYNEAANYLLASTLLVGAAALTGSHHRSTRILFGMLATLGLVAVWLTTSRGGITGAAVGGGVLAVMLLILGHRKKAKWFAPAVVTVPIVGAAAICAFLFLGWESAMQTRKAPDTSVAAVLDNDCRLYFLGIAPSSIADHPWTGGGSRCFSWEIYQKWDPSEHGFSGVRPDMIHNEIMQAATDYGLIGSVLLVTLLIGLLLSGLFRMMFAKGAPVVDQGDAWRIGGAAALVGMLLQSSFSFVFHHVPGVVLLGLCLGMISVPGQSGSRLRQLGARILLTIPALACVLMMFPKGIAGTQLTRILWSTFFAKGECPSNEMRIDALSEAIPIWPQSELHQLRGDLIEESISGEAHAAAAELASRALNDYQAASRLIPYEPYPVLASANMLSFLERDTEAENEYLRAIQLQGGMESTFRARFTYAKHLLAKGLRAHKSGDSTSAQRLFEKAATLMEESVSQMPWLLGDMYEPRIVIHEALGAVRESHGNYQEALQSYDFASGLPHGARCHYRAGLVMGRISKDLWLKRQSGEALYGFMEARKRVTLAGNSLPGGVSPADRVEYLRHLDESIKFLKGAKVEPKEW